MPASFTGYGLAPMLAPTQGPWTAAPIAGSWKPAPTKIGGSAAAAPAAML